MDDFWRELDEENKKKAPKPKTDGPLSKRAEKRVSTSVPTWCRSADFSNVESETRSHEGKAEEE